MNIDKLDDIIDKYNNTYHRKINIKPTDIKTRTYIDSDVENNDNAVKYKAGDHGKTSKYKKQHFYKKLDSKLV